MLNDPWPTINPGEFRNKITLLEPTAGSDESGATTTYAPDEPAICASAKIEYLRGDEMIKAGLDVSQVYLKITMWYRQQFTANKRIEIPSGNQFIIQAIENVKEMNVYQVMLCLGIGLNN